ncbi:hypothetical protein HY496_01500 [Candidatus Woesearchaeota archaeon]|nr:hypothetical protein [Candidatus Woesearchaeota archaeon]
MTRKDYVLIADAINNFIASSVENNNTLATGHAQNLIDIFVGTIGTTNPRFDAIRFTHEAGHKNIMHDEDCHYCRKANSAKKS